LSKQTTADLFFAVQLGCTLVSGGSEFVRLLTTSQGVNLSWLAFWDAFLAVNLALVIRAHRNQPSRVTTQTILSYASWLLLISACLGAMLWRGQEVWDRGDTVTAAVVGLGLVLNYWQARRLRLAITEPLVMAGFGVCFIALPQLTLTYKILTEGGAGMAGLMLLAGHLGIFTRLGQLWFAIREAGWDRNRQGAVISELANEATWILVTAAWLAH